MQMTQKETDSETRGWGCIETINMEIWRRKSTYNN